ncbi:MAG: molybdopterin synthase sulfur carrier subunit [Thermoprotei archaeon]|nr:MAG: molybdopterin synthase sulfur carrier subunit [Thermoprotei archaeon]
MKVRVKFFAVVRELAGAKELEVEVNPECTVMSLLEELAHKLPSKFREYVFKGGALSKSIIILVNGKGISELKGLDTKLSSGDEVAILPPVSGG